MDVNPYSDLLSIDQHAIAIEDYELGHCDSLGALAICRRDGRAASGAMCPRPLVRNYRTLLPAGPQRAALSQRMYRGLADGRRWPGQTAWPDMGCSSL